MDTYGNAFCVEAGRCFRLVYEESTSRPVHCLRDVITRGWWQDSRRVWWVVDACAEHAGSVGRGRPGPGSRIGSNSSLHLPGTQGRGPLRAAA